MGVSAAIVSDCTNLIKISPHKSNLLKKRSVYVAHKASSRYVCSLSSQIHEIAVQKLDALNAAHDVKIMDYH